MGGRQFSFNLGPVRQPVRILRSQFQLTAQLAAESSERSAFSAN
jgi:hypothetical protein